MEIVSKGKRNDGKCIAFVENKDKYWRYRSDRQCERSIAVGHFCKQHAKKFWIEYINYLNPSREDRFDNHAYSEYWELLRELKEYMDPEGTWFTDIERYRERYEMKERTNIKKIDYW